MQVFRAAILANLGAADKGLARIKMHARLPGDANAPHQMRRSCLRRSIAEAASGGSDLKPIRPAVENSGRRCEPARNGGWRLAGTIWSKTSTKGGAAGPTLMGAGRGPAEPVADAGLPYRVAQRQPAEISKQHADHHEDTEEPDPVLQQRRVRIARDLRDDQRHQRDGDGGGEEIGQDRHGAAEQAGPETKADRDGERRIDGEIETVHAREPAMERVNAEPIIPVSDR